MLYRIMREAFREKRTVVFDRRQEGDALIFLPKNDSYECWRYRTFGRVDSTLDVLRDPETFLLVDPSGKAGGGEPPISVRASTLIAASPNPDHFQQFAKNPSCARLYMSNWTLGELLAVRRFVNPNLSEVDVIQRFSDVGGIMRHVFGEFYAGVVKDQETRVEELSLELLNDPDRAQACVNRKGVSHRVFTYGDVDNPYEEPTHRFTSIRVYDLFMKRAEEAKKLDIAARIEDRCLQGPIGRDFENIVIPIVSRGGLFQVKLVRGEQEQELCLPANAEYKEDNETKDINYILANSTRNQPTVFARCPKNFPVADMVTSSGQLLNTTINASHNISCPGLAKILNAAGIHQESERKLDLYFCLPTGRYDIFNPTWAKPTNVEWVKQHVNVYALHIPLKTPPPWIPLDATTSEAAA
jgi:hypothetical protein